MFALNTDARGKTPVLVVGDFNAGATDWSSKWTNAKGRVLLEYLASLYLTILNIDSENTFNRDGRVFAIDITTASSALAIQEKKVQSPYFINIVASYLLAVNIDTKQQNGIENGWSLEGMIRRPHTMERNVRRYSETSTSRGSLHRVFS